MTDEQEIKLWEEETMTDEQAVELSVELWEGYRDAKDFALVGMGHSDCALCQKYYLREVDGLPVRDCAGCPIYRRTGKPNCGDTPYATALRIFKLAHHPNDQWRAACQKEIDLLKSLGDNNDSA